MALTEKQKQQRARYNPSDEAREQINRRARESYKRLRERALAGDEKARKTLKWDDRERDADGALVETRVPKHKTEEDRKAALLESSKRTHKQRRHSHDGRLVILLRGARNRAKVSGRAFDIRKEDLSIPSHCPILGIELRLDGDSKSRASAPSLDRIDSALGYVVGNVQVISQKANLLKNCATFEEVELLYRWFCTHRAKAGNP